MTTDIDAPGLDPEVVEHLQKIGTPIKMMETVTHGMHRSAPHLEYLQARTLAKLRAGSPMKPGAGERDQQFLACFIPVRHGKSYFTGRYLLCWLMGMYPGIQILFVTYSDDRARRWGVAARDLMAEWAPTLFGCGISKSNQSAEDWSLTNGSRARFLGMHGAITGEGAHIIIIDDTLKDPEQADSPTEKRKQVDWYFETCRNRLEPGGLMLCCVARWREDDLPGTICKPGITDDTGRVDDWEVIALPAIAEAPKPEPPPPPEEEMPEPPEGWAEGVEAWVEKWKGDWIDGWCDQFRADWRDVLGRREGEALWPERWPLKALEQQRDTLFSMGKQTTWDALHQQNPTPKEGGTFKVENWRKIGRLPESVVLGVRAWDLSASRRKGDFTVGVQMYLGPNNEVYVAHVVRDRLDPAGVQNLVIATADQDGDEVIIGMEEEKGASGKANSATYAAALIGYVFHAEPVSGDKELRASGYAAHQGNGLVYLVVDGTWDADEFIEEHRKFPNGRHDDQVDAASLAFRLLTIRGLGPAAANYQLPSTMPSRLEREALGMASPLARQAPEFDESDDEELAILALLERVRS